MTKTRKRTLIWLSTCAIALVGPISLALAGWVTLELPEATRPTGRTGQPPGPEGPTLSPLPTEDEIQRLSSRELRRRLYDPPPEPEPEPEPPKLPTFRLVGTLAGSQPRALIVDGSRETTLMGVGDVIADGENVATIRAIESGRIEVEHAGRRLTIEVEAEGAGR